LIKSYGSLSVGNTSGQNFNWTIPSNAEPGVYYVSQWVDATDTSTESNETNNKGCWAVTGSAAVGNLSATLRNENGTNATASKTKFIRYPGTVALTGSNPATFTGVATGRNTVEGYQLGPFNEYEYWGAVGVNVTAGQTATATINRNAPYCEDFWFEYNGARISVSNYIPSGARVTPKAVIRNKDSSSRSLYVTMGWRFGPSGSAVGTTPSPTVTVGANSTVSITHLHGRHRRGCLCVY